MRRRFSEEEDPERERRAGLRHALFQLRVAAFALGCLFGIFLFGEPLFPEGGPWAVVVVFSAGGVGVGVLELVRRLWTPR